MLLDEYPQATPACQKADNAITGVATGFWLTI
jgi:hypothetical protein